MKMLTKALREQLLRNGRASDHEKKEHFPVVKLFTPDAQATWLLTELSPDDPDLAFGLCDTGQGFPELGMVRISELAEFRGFLGLHIERDLYFRAKKTLTAYAEDARNHERIVT